MQKKNLLIPLAAALLCAAVFAQAQVTTTVDLGNGTSAPEVSELQTRILIAGGNELGNYYSEKDFPLYFCYSWKSLGTNWWKDTFFYPVIKLNRQIIFQWNNREVAPKNQIPPSVQEHCFKLEKENTAEKEIIDSQDTAFWNGTLMKYSFLTTEDATAELTAEVFSIERTALKASGTTTLTYKSSAQTPTTAPAEPVFRAQMGNILIKSENISEAVEAFWIVPEGYPYDQDMKKIEIRTCTEPEPLPPIPPEEECEATVEDFTVQGAQISVPVTASPSTILSGGSRIVKIISFINEQGKKFFVNAEPITISPVPENILRTLKLLNAKLANEMGIEEEE